MESCFSGLKSQSCDIMDTFLCSRKSLCLQGYYRIRQTAEQLRKKKEEEREARRRDRDVVEKPSESDGKPKVEEGSIEDSKEADKVFVNLYAKCISV